MKEKDSWFIRVWKDSVPDTVGIGEVSLIPGLSPDARAALPIVLKELCASIHLLDYQKTDIGLDLSEWPAVSFGFDLALRDLKFNGSKNFGSGFCKGDKIPINGLIWMGERAFMKSQIDRKLKEGFTCVKMKIGAIDFQEELNLLKYIRAEYSSDEVELRVDANGAFSPVEAMEKLKRLSQFELHSIEQPIMPRQIDEMAELCGSSPIDIALDEELIGSFDKEQKQLLLATIRPQYIILKPSLHGGFSGASEWVKIAQDQNIKWWATSALESNIGLNGIAQWVSEFSNPMPQGLGTGSLFTNNIPSPLFVSNGYLGHYTDNGKWDLSLFNSKQT